MPLNRRGLWCAIALALSANAWAGELHYDTAGFNWRPIEGVPDAHLRAIGNRLPELGVRKIQRLDSQGVAGPFVSFAKLTRAEQLAVLAMVSTENRGAEWDLLVPVGRTYVPVTVWWNVPKQLEVQFGEPTTSPLPTATAKDLDKYGIGPLAGTRGGWEPQALGLLDQALGMLVQKELEAVSALHFWRTETPSKLTQDALGTSTSGALLAHYQSDVQNSLIHVYDAALQQNDWLFVGTPSYPLVAPLFPLVHELGHAFSDAPARKAVDQIRQLEVEHKSLEAAYNKLVAANQREDVAQANAIAAQGKEIGEKMEALAVAVNDWRTNNPVRAAYLAALGDNLAATKYGRTDPDEGFAESFALYHTDPDALNRVTPTVGAWFAAQGHIEALAKAD